MNTIIVGLIITADAGTVTAMTMIIYAVCLGESNCCHFDSSRRDGDSCHLMGVFVARNGASHTSCQIPFISFVNINSVDN